MTDASPLVEAQQKFVDALPFRAAGAERCALSQALGRTLYNDVVAPLDSPPYPRVIVEGFLVNATDTAEASETNPVSCAQRTTRFLAISLTPFVPPIAMYN